MSNIKRLQEEKNDLIWQMKDLSRKAKKEKRLLGSEERTRFDKLSAECEDKNNQMRILKVEENALMKTATYVGEQNRDAANQEFRDFLIYGQTRAQGTSNSAGGYTINQTMLSEIETVRENFDLLKPGVCNWLTTEHGDPLKLPVVDDLANTASIVAEAADLTAGATDLVFTEKELNAYTLSSDLLKINYQLVEDSSFDILGYVTGVLMRRVYRKLNALVTAGTGSSQHNGIMTAATKGEDAAAWAITRTDIINLAHSVDPAYRNPKSTFFMFNDTTLSYLKALSIGSGDARPLWQPGMAYGEPDTLEGFKFIVNQDMEDIHPTYKPVAFGDFSKYTIRNVKEIRILNLKERFMDTGQYGAGILMRSDGDLMTSAACIKFIRNSTT